MKRTIFTLILLLILLSAIAVQAPKTSIDYTQPNGQKLLIKQVGDEWVHASKTTDGYTLLDENGWKKYAIHDSKGDLVISDVVATNPEDRNDKELSFLQTIKPHSWYSQNQITRMRDGDRARLGNFPHTGNVNLLVIPVAFSDMSMNYSVTSFDNMMNSPTNFTGSFKTFYEENSYNTYSVTSTICPIVTLQRTHDSFGPQNQWSTFASLAIYGAEPYVNFANFDNNGNNVVEGVVIIHAGQGQESSGNTNDIWSHHSSLGVPANVDGMSIQKYAIAGESGSFGLQAGVGVTAHEFGHLLGVPDFYNTGSGADPDCTGEWDLMSSGAWNNNSWRPAHHNAWSKVFLGWMDMDYLEMPGNYTISNSNITEEVYAVETPDYDEYFLLENRQQTGYNTYAPGHGLLIYHVDEGYILSHMNSNDVNSGNHKGLQIESANGQLNSTGTAFPDGTANSFTDDTDPASITWDNHPTNRPLENITESGGNISFMFWNGPGYNPLLPSRNFNAELTEEMTVQFNWSLPNILGSDYEYLSYSNMLCTQFFGMTSEDPLEVGIKYSSEALEDYEDNYIDRVNFYVGDPDASYTLNVYNEGNDQDITVTQAITGITEIGLFTLDLQNPPLLNTDNDLYIGISASPGDGDPFGCDPSTYFSGKSNLVKLNGAWQSADVNLGFEGDWCVEFLLSNVGYTRSYVPEAYRIYKEGELLTQIDDWETTAYEEFDLEEGIFEYVLTVVYEEGESQDSNTESVFVDFNLVPTLWVDGFEEYASFEDNFYPWRSIDLDQTNNYPLTSDFPGNGGIKSFLVFNPSATMPPLGGNWGAFEGTNYLVAMATNQNQGDYNNDWLISPNYDVVQNSVFLFQAKTVDSSYGLDRFRVLVSTGSIETDDFVQISDGEYIEPPTAWSEYIFSLNDYVGQRVRVAVNCISEATYALGIDNCTFDVRIGISDDLIQPIARTILNDNYPNPFNPKTSISFDIAKESLVELGIYNLRGQKVKTLVNELIPQGSHSVIWDGENDEGNTISSGVYFYKLQAGSYTKTKKMILLK
ncbi:MAG: M6 family metalloprotease domain-containing protein [Candidatus Zophobacter franzmannii]|nr:M6 family metalloprotease domain-containing protein [Candidatus Zophobacter franzmannii]